MGNVQIPEKLGQIRNGRCGVGASGAHTPLPGEKGRQANVRNECPNKSPSYMAQKSPQTKSQKRKGQKYIAAGSKELPRNVLKENRLRSRSGRRISERRRRRNRRRTTRALRGARRKRRPLGSAKRRCRSQRGKQPPRQKNPKSGPGLSFAVGSWMRPAGG